MSHAPAPRLTFASAAVFCACACNGGSAIDAGVDDASARDAAPTDASRQLPDSAIADANTCKFDLDGGAPTICTFELWDCPADVPICNRAQSLKSADVCYSCCLKPQVGCRETHPTGTESDCVLETPNGCPADRPVCCERPGLHVCVDAALVGWECE